MSAPRGRVSWGFLSSTTIIYAQTTTIALLDRAMIGVSLLAIVCTTSERSGVLRSTSWDHPGVDIIDVKISYEDCRLLT